MHRLPAMPMQHIFLKSNIDLVGIAKNVRLIVLHPMLIFLLQY